MFGKYFVKSAVRDIKPKIRLLIGITITLSFIVGLVNAPQYFQQSLLQSEIEAYPYDCQVTVPDLNLNDTLAFKDHLIQQEIPLQTLYPTLVHDGSTIGVRRSFLFANNFSLNYSTIITNRFQLPEKILIIGIDPSMILDPTFTEQFQATFQMDFTRLNESGVYLSSNYNDEGNFTDSTAFNYGEFEIQAFSPEYEVLSYTTAEVYDIPILGNFTVPDSQLDYLTTFIGGDSDWNVNFKYGIMLIGNIDYIQETFFAQLQPNITTGFGSYYNLCFDRALLDTRNYAKLVEQATSFKSIINENDMLTISQSVILWENAIDDYGEFIFKFQIICILISIPTIAFGIIFTNILYKNYFSRIRSSLTLMRIQGVSNIKIGGWILTESVLYGIVGGGLSILGGSVISFIFLQTTILPFSEAIQSFSFLQTLSSGFAVTNLLITIGVATTLSLICIIQPLRRFLQSNLAVSSFDPPRKPQKSKKVLWGLIFLLSIFPIISLLIFQNSPPSTAQFVSDPGLMLLGFLTIITAPFSPFLLILSSIYLISSFLFWFFEKNKILFQDILQNKYIANYSLKTMVRNQKKFLSIVFLISFSFSFVVLSNILVDSQEEYLDSIESYGSANGQLLNLIDFPTQSEFFDLLQDLNSQKDQFNFTQVNWQIVVNRCNTSVDGEKTQISHSLRIISEQNHADLATIPDNWLINSTSETILNQLTQPNTVIIPEFLQKSGSEVGSHLTVSYLTEDATIFNKTLEVIGVYKHFPLVQTIFYKGSALSRDLLVSNNTISNANPSQIYLVFYSNTDTPPAKEAVQLYIKVQYPTMRVAYSSIASNSIDFESLQLEQTVLRILEKESQYFLLMIFFGIIIYFNSVTTQRTQLNAHLKGIGLYSSEILKIEMIQNSVYLFLGMIISLVGIIASAVIILFLDLIGPYSPFKRTLVVNLPQLFLFLGITFMIFEGVLILQSIIQNKQLESDAVMEKALKTI